MKMTPRIAARLSRVMNLRELSGALASRKLARAVRSYFRGQLAATIGPFPAMGTADQHELIAFLYRSYAFCVRTSVQDLNECAKAAKAFRRRLYDAVREDGITPYDLRSLHSWIAKKIVKPDPSELESWSPAQKVAYRIAAAKKGDDALPGVGMKTASLWVKIMCRDVGFFDDYNTDRKMALWIPVDRVNCRMLRYLVPPCRRTVDDMEAGLNKSTAEQLKSHRTMLGLARRIMRGRGAAICLEHLWFIGTFYHENMRVSARGRRKERAADRWECVYPCCRIRDGLRASQFAYAGEIDDVCPLKGACAYDRRRYQLALRVANSGENDSSA
ncbi:MAG: hypothetical protein KKI08_21050 [Armatimonadetes bacterium]|nr:hypothetical protein [Armatimonadota bacterium]